jgi:hypothetical protein
MYSLRVLTGRYFIELQRCGLHDSSSHENDGSKYLKYDQIVSVHDSAEIASEQQLYGAQLRRNMQLSDSQSKNIEAKLQR